MTQTVEGHATSALTYVRDLPRFFGEMSPAVVMVAGVIALRDPGRPAFDCSLVWAGLVYVAFSLMATRLPRLRDDCRSRAVPDAGLGVGRAARSAARNVEPRRAPGDCGSARADGGAAGAAPARANGPSGRRDRFPEEVERAKRIQLQLQLPDAVLFNVPSALEVMFYHRTQPTSACRRTRKSKPRRAGLPVVIYQGVHPTGRDTWGLAGDRPV